MNPYQSHPTHEAFTDSGSERFETPSQLLIPPQIRTLVLRMVWGYPLMLLAALYATWMIGWMELGHPPRPSLDDPSSISWVVNTACLITGLLLVGFPAAVFFGATIQLCDRVRSLSERFLSVIGLFTCWVFTIAFLRWDPFLVMSWFMD
ncbi:MAG: hypothetical protein AAFX06_00230 [Planctomycetota bacterium]